MIEDPDAGVLRAFFYLMNVALASSHTVYQHVTGKLNLLDFKIVITNCLIGKHSNCQRAFPQKCPSKRKSTNQAGSANTTDHFSEYQVSTY